MSIASRPQDEKLGQHIIFRVSDAFTPFVLSYFYLSFCFPCELGYTRSPLLLS